MPRNSILTELGVWLKSNKRSRMTVFINFLTIFINTVYDDMLAYINNPNKILEIGTEIIDGNNRIYEGYRWLINQIEYNNIGNPITLIIDPEDTGYKRIDASYFSIDNQILLQKGTRTNSGVAQTPDIPVGAILLKYYDIDGEIIIDGPEPITGDRFIEKSDFLIHNFVGSGSDVIIPLLANGASEIRLQSGLTPLISIDGFDLSLITGNPDAKVPYNGKIFLIRNTSSAPITLKNSGNAHFIFYSLSGTDVVIPVNGTITVKYGFYLGESSFTEYFRNWTEPIDLSTKADLVGGKVPASQLPSYVDDVLEFANLAAFPEAGEAEKIYVALDTNFTYRWSGSVYVKISDSVKLDKSTTPSSVYGTDASGGQTMIPLTNFGTVKGTGTTNYLPKFTASGTIGDSQIFDNGTNVGIGTTSPSGAFHISGTTKSVLVENQGGSTIGMTLKSTRSGWFQSINIFGGTSIANGQQMQFGQYDNGKMFFFNSGNFPIGFYTNGTEKLSITASGNVGIGTTTAGARLDVRAQGTLATDIAFRVRNNTDTDNLLSVNGDGSVNIGYSLPNGRLTVISTSTTPHAIVTNIGTPIGFNAQFRSVWGNNLLSFTYNGNNNSVYETGWVNSDAGPQTKESVLNLIRTNVFSGAKFRWAATDGVTTSQLMMLLANGTLMLGTTTNESSAQLQMDSTSRGFLPPRMTTAQRVAIASPAAGLIVYDITENKHYGFNGTIWNALY